MTLFLTFKIQLIIVAIVEVIVIGSFLFVSLVKIFLSVFSVFGLILVHVVDFVIVATVTISIILELAWIFRYIIYSVALFRNSSQGRSCLPGWSVRYLLVIRPVIAVWWRSQAVMWTRWVVLRITIRVSIWWSRKSFSQERNKLRPPMDQGIILPTLEEILLLVGFSEILVPSEII